MLLVQIVEKKQNFLVSLIYLSSAVTTHIARHVFVLCRLWTRLCSQINDAYIFSRVPVYRFNTVVLFKDALHIHC